MRDAENEYPCQLTMFSPPFLIRRPAPSPRSAHATRFVTSNAWTSLVGLNPRLEWIHSTSAGLLFTSESQLPFPGFGDGPGPGAGVVFGVRKAWTTLHAPIVSASNALTRQNWVALFGRSVSTVTAVSPAVSFACPAPVIWENA